MGSKRTSIQQLFDEVSLGSPESAIGFVMWRVVARYQREMDRALLPDELTHLQFVTLALIAWFGRGAGPVTQVELARSAGIHPMQVSQTLKALEGKGMISRQVSELDARARLVAVTSLGLKALRSALPKAIAVQSAIFGDTGKPGGDLLTQLLAIDSGLPTTIE